MAQAAQELVQGGAECSQGLRTGDRAGFEKGMRDLSAFMPTMTRFFALIRQ